MAKQKKPTKKKAPINRVISPTEKKLRNKRNYQMKLRRDEYKNKEIGINELLKSKTEKIGKNIVYEVPDIVKEHLGIQKQNYKATKQTILNAYYNKVYKLSSQVNLIEDKLIKRFKFKQKKYLKTTKNKKGEITIPLGFVWEIDNQLSGGVFKNKVVKEVNSKNKKTDSPSILDEFNGLKNVLGSTEFVVIVGKEGKFKIQVINYESNKKAKAYLSKELRKQAKDESDYRNSQTK